MSELIRCPMCHGCKVILGMGGMQGDCPRCKSVGWINAESEQSASDTPQEDVKQLRDDLSAMIEAYEALKAEHEKLKAKLETSSAKTGKAKKAKK